MSRPLLTILCPVYNEEQTVPLFWERIKPVFKAIEERVSVNLVFLDNGSKDRTHDLVKDICRNDPRVYTIVMSRNFGYQRSVECGLRSCKGDLFVVMDVDCEDPPEMLPEFLNYYDQGYDIVYGERLDRVEGKSMILTRKLFYRITRMLSDEHFILDMAEFALITAEVRDAIVDDNNSLPFIRASIGRVGFNTKNIRYKRQKRIAGETHYNFVSMTIFAIAGVLSSSTLALRIPAYLFPFWFLAVVAVCVAGAIYDFRGFLPTLLGLGFTYCGFALASIGIYLARTYKNGLHRPNFIINKKKSMLQPGPAVMRTEPA